MIRVFYECHKCKRKHEGDEHTPETVAMVPSGKANEWVFVCVPQCPPADPA
jgi:hypothetical protein